MKNSSNTYEFLVVTFLLFEKKSNILLNCITYFSIKYLLKIIGLTQHIIIRYNFNYKKIISTVMYFMYTVTVICVNNFYFIGKFNTTQ